MAIEDQSGNKLRIGIFAVLLVLAVAGTLTAQTPHGISSDGRDFYVGYMPGILHTNSGFGIAENYYVIVGSYQDNNAVTVSYFGSDGTEIQSAAKIVSKNRCTQILLDRAQIAPARPGEQLEFKAIHIHSRYPVSVQCYDEGSATGGMYQAIPTSALGKSYVIASWFDNPEDKNPGTLDRDSSSSEFMIIAAYDETKVTFTPNSTTCKGVIGVNSGYNSDGKAHPTTITMRRGQTYWVRSFSVDPSDDLSGTTVVADKPIAVLGGQERALLGDPAGIWTNLTNDIRDVMIEQMTPVEDWGSDYPSIPMMPATGSTPRFDYLLKNGEGQLYRIFTNDAKGGIMDLWKNYPPQAYSTNVGLYQSPAASYENVVDPVDLLVQSQDANGNRKTMYAVTYDYYQGAHQFSPGGLATGGRAGKNNVQSGGGDQVQNSWTYKMPNEMNLVPIDRWRTNTIFKVPQNSSYKGYQFINIITNRDSLQNIMVTFNGLSTKPLKSYQSTKSYPTIPLHPELVGITLKLAAGDYVINGNTPFACYSYGRTETLYDDGWGYAAPCGELYGSRSESNPPKADVSFSCDHWDVRLHDSGPKDEGVADVMLLFDADGYYSKPGRVSYNTTLYQIPYSGLDPDYTPGDTSVSFQILIGDATKNAYVALYVVDRAGNDSVIEFHYVAPKLSVLPSMNFGKQFVESKVCSTFVLNVISSTDADTIKSPAWMLHDSSIFGSNASRKSPTFSWSSATNFPTVFHSGDSIAFSVCFMPTDTNNILNSARKLQFGHFDTLIIPIGCGFDTVGVSGKGITPIISASDVDFGNVAFGDTSCKAVSIKNIGNGSLILGTNWRLNPNSDFAFEDQSVLPDTIPPLATIRPLLCFHPSDGNPSSTRMDWGTNIPLEYVHQKKDTSLLTGNIFGSVTNTASKELAIDAITPNPSDRQITVSFQSRGAAMIQVFDVLGHEVLSKAVNKSGAQSARLDIPGLAVGTYFLRLSSGETTRSSSFEVRR